MIYLLIGSTDTAPTGSRGQGTRVKGMYMYNNSMINLLIGNTDTAPTGSRGQGTRVKGMYMYINLQ